MTLDTEHVVKAYDEDLGNLNAMIVEMGGLAESQLAAAIHGLRLLDAEAAARIIDDDKKLDALEAEIDAFTIRLLALRQPMADDLRQIIIALKISSNLERIGDYAKNIAKRTVTLTQTPLMSGAVGTISRMSRLVQSMIKNVLDAYIARDPDLADDVRLRDEEVDQIYSSLFRELLTYMMEDARNISSCTHLLFIAKNVERMGDHVTSIAEQIHFMVHGVMPEDERPKGDASPFTTVEPGDAAGD